MSLQHYYNCDELQIPYIPYVIKKSYEDIIPIRKYLYLFPSSKCNYTDRYGKNCDRKCSSDRFNYEKTFKHRKIFCWKHIQENIDTIIKLDNFIYKFYLIEKEIDMRLLRESNIKRKHFVNIEIVQLFKRIIKLVSENRDLIIIVKDVLSDFDSIYFKIFNNGIKIDYDIIIPYEIRLFTWTKCNMYIEENIKEKEKCINTLNEIINTTNNITEYLYSTNMFELNIINIIKEYI
jgi:hypothetical protein